MRGKLQHKLRFPPLKSGRKDEYILIFPGEKLVYTHFSGYVTPALIEHHEPH